MAPEYEKSKSEPVVWTKGDFCRAVYSEDGNEYEAEIESVNVDEEGNKYCQIKFLGYGNVETAWCSDLKPSLGETARKEQISSLSLPEVNNNDSAVEAKWKAEDFARAVYTEDGVEYEVKLTSIEKTDEGDEYANVEFLGFGNLQTVWLSDLKASQGEEARQAQIKAAGAGTVATENETPEPTDSSTETVIAANQTVEENTIPQEATKVNPAGDGPKESTVESKALEREIEKLRADMNSKLDVMKTELDAAKKQNLKILAEKESLLKKIDELKDGKARQSEALANVSPTTSAVNNLREITSVPLLVLPARVDSDGFVGYGNVQSPQMWKILPLASVSQPCFSNGPTIMGSTPERPPLRRPFDSTPTK